MKGNQADKGPRGEFAKIFRLLTAAKQEAEKMRLGHLTHLTNMALLQVVLDWEDIDPEFEADIALQKLVGAKAQVAMKDASENIVLLEQRC